MSETDIPTDQQNKETPEKESGSKSLPTIWNRAKEKYKSYCCNTYVHCKKWLSRPWWFQETDPIARFTGWVAAFTFVLVLVSFLQFCTLQSTDKTTRDALTASNRAWIAPTNATITSPEKDKPLTITVFYVNTGHSPAFSVIGYHAHSTFSSSDWNNGTASRALDKFVTECFNFTQLPPESEVVYPTINSTFRSSTYDSDESAVGKYFTTDDLIAGNEVYVSQGCFAYRSLNAVHHSAFCYYYRAKVTKLPNMGICNIGNNAE